MLFAGVPRWWSLSCAQKKAFPDSCMWTPPSSTWTHVEMSEIVSWSTAPQTATLPFLYFSALFFLLGCPWRCFLQLSLDPHSFFKFFIPPHFHISCFAFLLLSFHFSLLSPDLLLLLTLSHFPFIPTAHFSPLPLISSCSILIWILQA